MRLNTKCSVALHCLVFLSEYEDQTKITSELLAKSTGCNSSAIRSILNDLQKAGIVSVVRGIGGAHLNKAPADLTFWDVYHALEPGGLEHFIGFHPNPSDKCPVGKMCIRDRNGTQYFVCGNNRIKISEHFAAGGKPLGDLIVDVVRHTAEKAAST